MILISIKTIVQKLLLVVFSIFLIWQSTQLGSGIAQRTSPQTLREILTQSILLNLFITGIFLVGYALPLHKLLPASYYNSVKSQSFATACAILKIELFRKIIRLTFWSPRNNKKHFFNGLRSGFAQFERNTRISESGHTFAFVIILVVSLYIGFFANIRLAIITTLINVIFNFYPAMLQRYNRARLQFTMTLRPRRNSTR
jgi:hypothetical protein